MAIAMESPAHPFEELGVTRLWIESREEGQRGCGHLFCRRWFVPSLSPRDNQRGTTKSFLCSISKWIAGDVSCAYCDQHHEGALISFFLLSLIQHDSCPTCRYLIVPRSTDADSSAASVTEVDDALRQLQSQMRIQRALFGGGNPRSMPGENRHAGGDRERAMRDLLPAEALDGFGGEGGRRQRGEDDRSEYLGMYS
jgi:hypothetical protein